MQPLSASAIQGVWATPLIDAAVPESTRLARLSAQIDYLACAGVQGVYSHGTAAEFHAQDDARFRQLARHIAQVSTEVGLPFQIGASHPFAPVALKRIAFARQLEPAAIQIILPDWVPLRLEEAADFLDGCVAAADGVGLVLYHPPHAKREFGATELIHLLLERPGVVGIKCGGGDTQWYERMTPLLESRSVFIPGHHMATGIHRGASGSYSNVCCLNPRATVNWYHDILAGRDSAFVLEQRLCQFLDEAMGPFLKAGYPGFACDKFLASIGHWTTIGAELLWPYQGIPGEEANRVRALGEQLIPEFFQTSRP